MIKKTLATLILITSIAPIKSYGSGFITLPSLSIVAPTDLLLGEKVGLSEAVKGCNGYLTGLIFFTALCFAKDVAEIKMDAENVVFGSPISDAAKVRLISLIADIKEKVPAARELSDDAVIIELVNSQLVKK